MIVWLFLTICTVILPAAREILSLFTPAITGNVPDELPHFKVTVAGDVEKTTAHIESYSWKVVNPS